MINEFTMMDFISILPEIFLAVIVIAILLMECFMKSICMKVIHITSLIGLVGAFILIFVGKALLANSGASTYYWLNEVTYSYATNLLKATMLIVVFLGLCYSVSKLTQNGLAKSEYYILILLSTIGMLVLVSANSLLMIYLGLELMSLPMYALVAFNRESHKATEAAMKYFIMGAMASAILLFGMALMYGAAGTLQLDKISDAYRQIAINDLSNNLLLIFAIVFIVVGIAFKLGVAPFHAWVPDVYEGAPAPVAMFIGAAPKIAAISMGYSLLLVAGHNIFASWQMMLSILAVISFIIGNFVALRQTNIRRMLGYSAISHAGFMLLGLFLGDNSIIASSAYFYAITYALTTTAAFGLILYINKNGDAIEKISDLKGLGRKHPWYALLMSVVMLSMGGIPPFVGFFAKLSVLMNVYYAGYGWLVIIGLLASVVGLFYYLRVIKVMYFDEADDVSEWSISGCKVGLVVLNINVVALLVLGVFPTLLMQNL